LPQNSHNISTENYPDSHSGIFPTTETFYPSAIGAAHSTKSSTSGDGCTKEPSTPSRHFLHSHGIKSQPVHTLRSETLGQIGKSELQAKTKSASNNYSLASSIATLLNPSPPSQSAISPNYCQTDSAIDRVLPRPLLYLIIGLFKDFVYPLTPCVHVPTLYQDLARRRELDHDQSEWTALIFAIVMSTLVQVPRAFVPLSRSEVSALAERCLFETRQWSMSGYSDNLTVNAGKSHIFLLIVCSYSPQTHCFPFDSGHLLFQGVGPFPSRSASQIQNLMQVIDPEFTRMFEIGARRHVILPC
jgi:hypothetical protein